MNLGILKTVIGTVAPSLGTALGGPMGGMAVNLVTKALGIDVKSSPKQLQAAVEQATPEQLAALKKVETEFEVRMKELDVDLFKLVALFGFVGYIFLVTLQPPSENSDTIVSLVLGYLGGLVSGISSFYFGASHSKGD